MFVGEGDRVMGDGFMEDGFVGDGFRLMGSRETR